MTNTTTIISSKLLEAFIETVSTEIGVRNLPTVLKKSGLPANWADPANAERLGGQAAAEAYAGLQQAIRAYYGRGARGILQRIGCSLWTKLLENASLRNKAQAKIIRGLPETMRRKSTMDLLSRLLSAKSGDVVVHTLDLDLLLIDHISPTTYHQHDDEPICYVTQGLIRESIYWATSREPSIEERRCQATGAKTCDFKVTFGA